MRKKSFVLFLFIIPILVNCSRNPELKSSVIPNQSPIVSSMPLMQTEGITTVTPVVQTLTPTTTNTVQILNNTPTMDISALMNYEKRCIELLPQWSPELSGKGTIIFYGMQGSNGSKSLNTENGEMNRLIDNWKDWEWKISPSDKWISYQSDDSSENISIFDIKGKLINSVSNRGNYAGWIDDTSLAFYNQVENEDPLLKLYKLTTINAFTGDQKVMPVDFPNIDTIDFYSFPLIYSHDLTRVVYPYNIQEETGFLLYDTKENKVITLVQSPIYLAGKPIWSPDDQYVMFQGGRVGENPDDEKQTLEIFILDKAGEKKQLTDFKSFGVRMNHNPEGYQWSPNGKYIALWLFSNDSEYDQLAVIDIYKKKVTNYCLPGMKEPGNYAPIWSPDSNQLAIFDPTFEKPTMIVDISKEKAYTVGKFLRPVFWLENIPDPWKK